MTLCKRRTTIKQYALSKKCDGLQPVDSTIPLHLYNKVTDQRDLIYLYEDELGFFFQISPGKISYFKKTVSVVQIEKYKFFFSNEFPAKKTL